MKKQVIKKIIKIKGLKFYSFEEVLRRASKSKGFQKAYDEELARLKLAHQIRTMRRY